MASTVFSAGTTVSSDWLNAANLLAYPVATVAALKQIGSVGQIPLPDGAAVVSLRGYYSNLDGGEGLFLYDSSSSTTADNGLFIAPTLGGGRWKRVYQGQAVNVKWFGAKGDGTTDDTAAVQAALDASLYVYVPLGTFKITAALNLRDGHHVQGAGRDMAVFSKTNYSGAVFSGVDTDDVTLEGFTIAGAGAAVGSGNKGIDIHVSLNEICANIKFADITVTDVNDTGIYAGTCSFVTWSNIKTRNMGFAGIWIDGGDGHHLLNCTTKNDLIGYYINAPSGYGPTTVVATGCYAEQSGAGFKIVGGKCVTLIACGVEAAIDRTPNTQIGYSYWINGGSNIKLLGCLARNDTIGAAITAPFVLIDGSADQVEIDGFQREVSGVYGGPTAELVTSAATAVKLGQSNFTYSKITSGGKILYAQPLTGSATYDAANLADGAGVTTTVTVTGAALGDFAEASLGVSAAGITVTAYVSATDTVSVRIQNESTGAVDLASTTIRARVWKV